MIKVVIMTSQFQEKDFIFLLSGYLEKKNKKIKINNYFWNDMKYCINLCIFYVT